MARPTLVYDDDCGFCSRVVAWLAGHDGFVPVGFSELSPDQRARLPDDWEACAHLLTDDAVYSFGAAMETALARTDLAPPGALRVASGLPGYDRAREAVYRWVADHRSLLGRAFHR